MQIAFDLDDTLIPGRDGRPHEPTVPYWFLGLWFKEPLRKGSIELLRTLQGQGHRLWIYTTSNRPEGYLRFWFALHGVRFVGIVNYDWHEKLVRAGHIPKCSKYPPAFGIDLLIDDSDGVALEGKRYGFVVLVIDTLDENWTERVLAAVQAG